MPCKNNFINMKKISEISGLVYSTIHFLYTRNKLPKPYAYINGKHPIWKQKDIEKWVSER